MYLIEDHEIKKHDYVTYARQFDSYRWFKPILTLFFFVLFYVFLSAVLAAAAFAADFMITGGDWQSFLNRFSSFSYDSISVKDPIGSVVYLGSVALMLPAFWFARGIVRERPFTSYTSSRGGWGMWIFIKCLIIALIVCAAPTVIYYYYFQEHGAVQSQFVNYGLYFVIALCPLQCLAEEYIFHGFINQALGAWLRIPIIAIILSSVGFAALHPYNMIGQATILVSGLAMGISAWFGRGLEVSSAIHIVNNMTAFLLDGFGLSSVATEVPINDAVLTIAIDVLYVAIIFFLSRKTDWFDRAKFDDAQSHNDMREAKRRKKAAKRAARQSGKE